MLPVYFSWKYFTIYLHCTTIRDLNNIRSHPMHQADKLLMVVPKFVNVTELPLLYRHGPFIKEVLLYSFLKLLHFCFCLGVFLPQLNSFVHEFLEPKITCWISSLSPNHSSLSSSNCASLSSKALLSITLVNAIMHGLDTIDSIGIMYSTLSTNQKGICSGMCRSQSLCYALHTLFSMFHTLSTTSAWISFCVIVLSTYYLFNLKSQLHIFPPNTHLLTIPLNTEFLHIRIGCFPYAYIKLARCAHRSS